MRTLVLLLLMTTPTLAANPCEELARAICPSEDVVGQCVAFIDNEMRAPDGKAMTGVNRLMGCKLALDDEATITDYKARMQAKAETRWYTMQVTVQPRKADGSPWDALGGAPDIAACFNIDGKPTGCVPDAARGPKCRDAMSCEFRVHARRDAVVMVSVVDVDEMSNDDIGHCNFVAGRGAADCRGQLSLAPEGVDSPAAGGVIDLRIVGWWEVDVEGTIAQFPDSAKLSIEQRKAVIEEMSAGPGAGYFEFTKEGRVSAKVGEELTEGTYVIIGLKGKVLTVELREGEEVETVEITVVDTGLLVKQGEQALALRRAR